MAAGDYDIVILGGNFGGLRVAHYLLRQTIPALEASDNSRTYKVTLVSPSTKFFFKVGAPRLFSPKLAPVDKAFLSIDDGFKDYPKERFRFVQGEAIDLKEQKRNVTVKLTESGETATVAYDSLVLATGSTSNSALWTLHGSDSKSRAAFEEILPKLPEAKSITVIGGGPAGVETAGELGAQFGHTKKVTMLSGSSRLLTKLRPATSEEAASHLSKLGVTVTHNLRLSSSSLIESTGQTQLTLSDGSTTTTDIFIDATGATPNTSFLPTSWLTAKGHVETDVKTLRATAAGPNVYALGDVASYSLGSIFDVNNCVIPLASSILVDLSPPSPSLASKQKLHNQSNTMTQLVPIGPKGGVGLVFGWRVPSWFVWAIKSRTYMFDKAVEPVMGLEYIKA
ncbi:hypothetical protein MMC16_002854 [Acarospora aff. strigata]|nr:hypothetical protein [Acarospora aff. strigata]